MQYKSSQVHKITSSQCFKYRNSIYYITKWQFIHFSAKLHEKPTWVTVYENKLYQFWIATSLFSICRKEWTDKKDVKSVAFCMTKPNVPMQAINSNHDSTKNKLVQHNSIFTHLYLYFYEGIFQCFNRKIVLFLLGAFPE